MEANLTEWEVKAQAPYPKLQKWYYAQEVNQIFSNVKIREVNQQTIRMMLELIVLGRESLISEAKHLMTDCKAQHVRYMCSHMQGLQTNV